MQGRCLDIASISRYLHRLAELEDVLNVEGHVDRCARCRDKLQRMKRYSETLFDDYAPDGKPQPGCPSLIALEHYLRDSLSERQMIRIQEHLHRCGVCACWTQRRHPDLGWLQPQRRLATRAPDLDLRVAPQGVRVDAGMGELDFAALPTLARRLELPVELGSEPNVTLARRLAFRRHGPGWELSGRVDLFGLEGFRLAIRLRSAAQPLALWTRERVQERIPLAEATAGFTRLLVPGHYFVGPSALDPPYLAVSVEADFLSAADLAACGYDACRQGTFHKALAYFAQAVALDPSQPAYAAMQQCTRVFAAAFELDGTDRSILWAEDERELSPATPSEVPELAAEQADLDAIVVLVRSLRARAERGSVEPEPGAAAAVRLSRRRFRDAYILLLRRLQELRTAPAASVESPMGRA